MNTASGRLAAVTPLPAPPGAVSAADGSVWVAEPRAGQGWRIDPGTGAEARVPVGGEPGAVASGGSRMRTGIRRIAVTTGGDPGVKFPGFPTDRDHLRTRIVIPRSVRHIKSLFCRTGRGITSTPGMCRPRSTWSPGPRAFRKQLQTRPSRTSVAARPAGPANSRRSGTCCGRADGARSGCSLPPTTARLRRS